GGGDRVRCPVGDGGGTAVDGDGVAGAEADAGDGDGASEGGDGGGGDGGGVEDAGLVGGVGAAVAALGGDGDAELFWLRGLGGEGGRTAGGGVEGTGGGGDCGENSGGVGGVPYAYDGHGLGGGHDGLTGECVERGDFDGE